MGGFLKKDKTQYTLFLITHENVLVSGVGSSNSSDGRSGARASITMSKGGGSK